MGHCKNMHAIVYVGLALNRGPSLHDSVQCCHREQGSTDGAEASKVPRGIRGEETSCTHCRPGRAGGDIPPWFSLHGGASHLGGSVLLLTGSAASPSFG